MFAATTILAGASAQVMFAATTILAGASAQVPATQGASVWPPAVSNDATVQDLHREYNNIFKHGNRNAASHLWAAFLLERAHTMTAERLELMFSGFCAVSGSPVRPSDYTRYRLELPLVAGGNRSGYMYYCCWPCVCDSQDFIRIDTKNVTTASGVRQYHWTVLGNPCLNREKLRTPFTQPFYNRGPTTLEREAPEVRCGDDGTLLGAHLSDNGFTIVNMFFDAAATKTDAAAALPSPDDESSSSSEVAAGRGPPTPGRMSVDAMGTNYQDMYEYGPMCTDRAANGYNSGMGEIFRKVAEITPVQLADNSTAQLGAPSDEACDAEAPVAPPM